MSAPVRADASTVMSCDREVTTPSVPTSLRVRWLMLQKRNMMQAALKRALMVLTMRATMVGSLTNWVNRFPMSMKKGAPGGCPTSNL